MRIGIDFDNTIICYDEVFAHLAKMTKLVTDDYAGSKRHLREIVQASAEGDIAWQRLQGKAYGEGIVLATLFPQFKSFISACNARNDIELFIVSHKTELGHFDEKKINLRDAARGWLRAQGLFGSIAPLIPEQNVFFETTREEKINRIQELKCTHFIDDLPEVLFAPTFPDTVKRFLFQPDEVKSQDDMHQEYVFTNWVEIKNAIFTH
jgi:hypothetical protein